MHVPLHLPPSLAEHAVYNVVNKFLWGLSNSHIAVNLAGHPACPCQPGNRAHVPTSVTFRLEDICSIKINAQMPAKRAISYG